MPNLEDLSNVDLTTNSPIDGDVLTYNSTQAKWVADKPFISTVSGGKPYIIELDRWGIKNNGTESTLTTKGINNAIMWAKAQGYTHVKLQAGTYSIKLDDTTFSGIVMPSNMHFEMDDNSILQLEATSSPKYRIFDVKGIKHSKISGGTIIGDKKSHIYELRVKFMRGGVNADGTLNNNPNFIRSEVIDRYASPGILRAFRLWSISGITAKNYNFFQYKDTISSTTLVGTRTNGQFAPSASTGRGWFAPIESANKMIFTIDITSSPLTDVQIAQINAKIDSENYTHEWGQGIEILGSSYIEVERVNISNCTGDAISTGWLEYKLNPAEYTQEQMGAHVYIHNCELHHCRRQGISLCSANDVYVFNNKIHSIGKADDGVTVDGIAPMFGIDIESMWSESNIPTWRPELNREGFELNTRIHIYNNHIFNNARGHFVNADGIHVTVENNIFEGSNVGGVSSYQNNWYVKYINNTFIGCEFTIKGDNFVNGAICNKANIKMQDVRGAVVQNCQIQNGVFYGSSVYGYFGPPTVNVATSTFSYNTPHGMGNGAKICFEQWVGKVPAGISVDKLYYTVNITSTSFQVSETLGGKPVSISDAGQPGFHISRFDYGRCYISNVTVEREWRNDNAVAVGFGLLVTGAILKNINVKNYDVDIKPPANYAGRPITVESLTVIEGATNIECSNISDCKFIRAKSSRMGGDIALGSTSPQYTRRVQVQDVLFQNVGVNFEGNVVTTNSTFLNVNIGKSDTAAVAIIAQCYLESTKINLRWLTKEKTVTFANCVFNNITSNVSASTRFIANTTL